MKETPVTAVKSFPNKPITIIVPFAAGGSSDMMARSLEKVAVKHLGQALVVSNIPGGAATIGWNELAGAKPDGYTIGFVVSSMILQPIYGTTRYHYPTALEPIAQITSLPIVAAVRSDQPWNNFRELVEYTKQHPGELKYGHPGIGSGNHVVSEMAALKAGMKIEQVPFRGESESIAALLGGHIQLIFTPTPAIKEYVKNGNLKILGIAKSERSMDPFLNNVPTFKEQGIDLDYNTWQGIAVPKGLPPEEKEKLVEGIKAMIVDPEFVKAMEGLGMTIDYLDNQNFAQKWTKDNSELTQIVKETGIADKIASQKN